MIRRGQVTGFVIFAIIIVAAIALFFFFRSSIFGSNIPASLVPVYDRYSECISQELSNGIKLLQAQGGRLNVEETASASDFNPFSSNLNFLGLRVPYWYGISGNNLVINDVPSISDMEKDLGSFVSSRIGDCDFSDFYAKGFSIDKSSADATVKISDNSVSVSVKSSLSTGFGDDTAVKRTHDVKLDSKLGSLYGEAVSIYNNERSSLFLENYALDVLQSYAPVDGVEIQCSPKIWKTQDVVKEIKDGLQANIGNIKVDGSGDKYFNQNIRINNGANFIYLPESFPSKIEITPASQALMVAEPVGTQEGMGIMGFCYVPYHFVYDLRFPVLVQVGDGIDNFQFPVIVNVDNNLVNSLNLTYANADEEVDVCSFAENDLTVNTYDSSLNPLSVNLSYNCFDSLCNIGQTSSSGRVDTKVPACVNGYLIASADGYADSKILFSSNSQSSAELVLQKEHNLNVQVMIGNKVQNNAIVHFIGTDGYSSNAIIPDSSSVKLKEGLYDIEVYIYGNSSIVIPSTTKTECVQVSKGGIAGFLGAKTEKCVNVDIPSTKIDYALIGGGKLTEYYLLDSELSNGNLIIHASELPKPSSLEQLQYNYEVFNSLGLEVDFQ